MPDAQLEVFDTSGRRLVPVDKPVFTIGRRSGNDLCVIGGDVSREHAEIALVGGNYVLRDRSTRGTYVNEQAVSEAELSHGDRVRLGGSGEAGFVFLAEGEPPPPRDARSAAHDLRQMAMLFEGLRAMGSARALDDVLALVLDLTIEFTGAERGFIMVANSEGRLEFTRARAAGRIALPGKTFDTSRRIPEGVFATGESRAVTDLLDDEASGVHRGTIALGIRHVLCLPLRLVRYAQRSDDDLAQKRIGVLYLDSRQKGSLMSETTLAGVETLAVEAAAAIENARLYQEEIEKQRLEQELSIAARIQRALLPEPRFRSDLIEAAAISTPCRAIGGDFFDYLDLPGGAFGFALGDVAGKGPSAALLTAAVQGIFGANATEGYDPADTISRVNRGVVRRAVQARFVTMVYGVISAEGVLTYCNAGHNPPLLIGRRGLVHLEQGGLVLGLLAEAAYEQERLQLEPGDLLVVFSDGVSESMNPAGDQYGESRIASVVREHMHLDPGEILDRLLDDVQRFSDGTPPHDDLTALILRYQANA
jgi:serine phosphatase RsbU (regulator of sigma subunit)